MTIYQSDRQRQHAEGRAESVRIARELASRVSTPKRRVTYRLNEVTGKMVEVR